MLQKFKISAESVPLSAKIAEILNLCRNCINLKFMQKVCPFLQISAESIHFLQKLNCRNLQKGAPLSA